jgi:hypothetical protein
MQKDRIITTCYHCGNTGVLDYKSTVTWKDEDIVHGGCGEVISYTLIEHIDWGFYECPVCHNPTLIRNYTFDAASYSDHVETESTTAFPFPLINKDGVPQTIADAFDAAVKTKGIDLSICLLSLRRVLEMIAKDKEATGKTLEDKINSLVERKELPEMLNDACWIIRQLGNSAAHADDVKFYQYDVERVIEYVAVIIEYLYSLPKRLKDTKDKIIEKKQNK